MRKKIQFFLLILLLVCIIILGFVVYRMGDNIGRINAGEENTRFTEAENGKFGSGNLEEKPGANGMGDAGNLFGTEDGNMEMVAGSGVISIGTVNEIFPVDSLTSELEIETVFVAAGESINTETAILKFTEDSIESAREELETLVREADLAYRSGKIEYEQAKINAKYEHEEALLAGEQASVVYNETIANIEENVVSTQKTLEEAKAQIAEYEEAFANNTYAMNLEAAQKEFDENYNLLVSRMEEWGIEWSEVTSGTGGGSTGNSMQGSLGSGMPDGVSSMTGRAGGDSTRNQLVNGLRDLYSVLEENRKVLDQAEEEYEKAVNNTNYEMLSLKLSLPELEEAAASAQENYESSLIQAKLTKESTLAEAELADKNYQTDLEKAEADFENLRDAKVEAEENLAIFEERMGNGYYYPAESGTVLRVNVRNGRQISGNSTLVTLRNTEKVTVSVSVDQADISKLKVGDSAIIQSEDSGMAQGVILSINPVANSSGRSSVTYTVLVELTGNQGRFSSNESVSVYFTVGGSGSNES